MIKIDKPIIENIGDNVYLKCHIIDETQKLDEIVYYMTNIEYGKYFVEEVADAFVVAMLLPATAYGENIMVDAPISERLYYNLQNSVLYMLSVALKKKPIKIFTRGTLLNSFKSNAVGCGCSLGVDSFAAMMQHLADDCPESYKITHLTYFNVGAMGYVNLEKAKISYEKDLMRVQEFAKIYNLPIVCLESNFSVFFKDFDFDASGDIRNFSAALSLQKLFGKYLYASSFAIKEFRFDAAQTGYYETLLAPLLSTENMEIVIANPDMNRVDKTKYIIKFDLPKKYLYVCWKELIANKYPNSEIARIKDQRLNCSRCDKCLRTLLALDLLGEIENYREIFDLPYYYQIKDWYVIKVLINKENSAFYAELQDLMKEVAYKPSIKIQFVVIIAKNFPLLYRVLSKLKRMLKK